MNTIAPAIMFGMLTVIASISLVSSLSSVPTSLQATYRLRVVGGNSTVTGFTIDIYLAPGLNGSLVSKCDSNSSSILTSPGYVNISINRILPNMATGCEFSVRTNPNVITVNTDWSYFVNAARRQYELSDVELVVSILERTGLTSFDAVSYKDICVPQNCGAGFIKQYIVYDFEVMLALLDLSSVTLLLAIMRKHTRQSRYGSSQVVDNFPYCTLLVYFANAMIFFFVGVVQENGAAAAITNSYNPQSVFFNFLIGSIVNSFFHTTSGHFESNMYTVVPWIGVSSGILPIGFISESIFKVRRRRILLPTYLIANYVSFIELRYNATGPGVGASLSLYAIAGLSVVAGYCCFVSRTDNPKLRLVRYLGFLYVGYAIIVYLSYYLYPLDLSRFTGLITIWSFPISKSDALAHLLAGSLPIVFFGMTSWLIPSKLKLLRTKD